MKKCKRTISVSVHKRVMTPREAILRIKHHMEIHKLSEPNAIYITEALNMAIQALEKHISKKPMQTINNAYCPNCKEALGKSFAEKALQLPRWYGNCFICGQALDWIGEE